MDHAPTLDSAYTHRLAELQSIDQRRLRSINVDVASAVMTVLGTLPRLATLREAIRALPGVDHELVDGLEEYALAAAEASRRHAAAGTDIPDLTEIHDRARRVRRMLRADASALAKRRLLPEDAVVRCRGGSGYTSVAFELMAWSTLFVAHWPSLEGKTAATHTELVAAKNLAEQLLRAAAARERRSLALVRSAKIRDAAFTMLTRSYDEVRRAVDFLRRKENDVESVVPSLYRKKKRKGAKRMIAATNRPAPPVQRQLAGGVNRATAMTPEIEPVTRTSLPVQTMTPSEA